MKKVLLAIVVLLVCSFGKSWELVWSDEFDASTINTNNWDWDTVGNSWGWGNNEDQYYTYDHSENSRVENGNLIIEAHKESMGGKEYTSARLRTKGKASWLYGKVEIRAKLPGGKGSWPALWMLPEDDFYGGWPSSGEIDIMEYVGVEPKNIYGTIHTKAYNHVLKTEKGSKVEVENVTDSFHLYRMEWFPDSISFYVDSTHIYTFTPENKSDDTWPFNKPFHLLMNVAVGGDWGGYNGIDTTIFPIQMMVDYVRVYKEIDTPLQIEALAHGEGEVTITPQKDFYAFGDTVVLTATAKSGMEFVKWNGAVSTSENSFTYVVTSHVSFGAIFRVAGELIKNGDFSNDFANWDYYNEDGTTASFETTSEGGKVTISKAGSNEWDIQLSQKGLSLIEGKSYTLKATVSSPDSLSFQMGLGMSDDPWEAYLSEEVTLNKEKKELTFTISMDKADPTGRVFFDLGKSSGTIEFHSVSLLENSTNPIKAPSFPTSGIKKISVINSNLHIEGGVEEVLSLTIIDLKGRALYQVKNISGREIVDLSRFPLGAGVHYIQVKTSQNIVYGTKFIIS